jgi:hypothetical protein
VLLFGAEQLPQIGITIGIIHCIFEFAEDKKRAKNVRIQINVAIEKPVGLKAIIRDKIAAFGINFVAIFLTYTAYNLFSLIKRLNLSRIFLFFFFN